MTDTDRPSGAPGPAEPTASTTPMSLLEAGVPLSLLIDLSRPEGPGSAELLVAETAPDSVWYRTPRNALGDC